MGRQGLWNPAHLAPVGYLWRRTPSPRRLQGGREPWVAATWAQAAGGQGRLPATGPAQGTRGPAALQARDGPRCGMAFAAARRLRALARLARDRIPARLGPALPGGHHRAARAARARPDAHPRREASGCAWVLAPAVPMRTPSRRSGVRGAGGKCPARPAAALPLWHGCPGPWGCGTPPRRASRRGRARSPRTAAMPLARRAYGARRREIDCL
mmetsp:Transcript_8964/g.30452  ORF Transcript_8964/g.30452 Transcript_8964/m.30452 type:complete len:213 (+) Transcript_8964:155-793(+)